jgi:hypothetical protein
MACKRDNRNIKRAGVNALYLTSILLVSVMALSIAQRPFLATASAETTTTATTTTTTMTRDSDGNHNLEWIKLNYEKWEKMAWHYNHTKTAEENLLELQKWWCTTAEGDSAQPSPQTSETLCNNPSSGLENLMAFYEYYGDTIILKTAWSHSSYFTMLHYDINKRDIRQWIFMAYQAAIAEKTVQ